METGPQLKASSDRLVKPGIEHATPGLQGKRFVYPLHHGASYKIVLQICMGKFIPYKQVKTELLTFIFIQLVVTQLTSGSEEQVGYKMF